MGAGWVVLYALVTGLIGPWLVISALFWWVVQEQRVAVERAAAQRRVDAASGPGAVEMRPQDAASLNGLHRRRTRLERAAAASTTAAIVTGIGLTTGWVVFDNEITTAGVEGVPSAGAAPKGTEDPDEMAGLMAAALDGHSRAEIDAYSCARDAVLTQAGHYDTDVADLLTVVRGSTITLTLLSERFGTYDAKLVAPASVGGADFRVTASLVPGIDADPTTCGATASAFRVMLERAWEEARPGAVDAVGPVGGVAPLAAYAMCAPGAQRRAVETLLTQAPKLTVEESTPFTVSPASPGSSIAVRTGQSWDPPPAAVMTPEQRRVHLAQSSVRVTFSGVSVPGRAGFVLGDVTIDSVTLAQARPDLVS